MHTLSWQLDNCSSTYSVVLPDHPPERLVPSVCDLWVELAEKVAGIWVSQGLNRLTIMVDIVNASIKLFPEFKGSASPMRLNRIFVDSPWLERCNAQIHGAYLEKAESGTDASPEEIEEMRRESERITRDIGDLFIATAGNINLPELLGVNKVQITVVDGSARQVMDRELNRSTSRCGGDALENDHATSAK